MKTLEMLSGYDSVVRRCMEDWEVPGMAVGIVREQRVIHAKGYGYRDVAARLPFTENTMFNIDSCTKAFIAAAIGVLIDDGVIDIDRPIREFVPSFQMSDLSATERATVRDLLAMRTGMPNAGHDWMWLWSTASMSDLFFRLKYLELNADFRSIWQYSGFMYLVSAYIVELLSGMPWDQFIRERVFVPLGMTSSCFEFDTFESGDDRVVRYTRKGEKLVPARGSWGPLYERYKNQSASVVSTTVDMCSWLRLMMLRGPARTRQYPMGAPISEQTLATLHSPQIPCPSFFNGMEFLDSAYAMGWICQPYRGKRLIVHWGAGIDGLTITSFMPDEKIGVIVNSSSREHFYNAINAVTLHAYDCVLGLKPIPFSSRWKKQAAQCASPTIAAPVVKARKVKPAIPLKELPGKYTNPGYGDLELKTSRGNLHINYNSLVFKLLPKTGNTFESKLAENAPVELSDWWGVREVSFSRSDITNEWSISVPFEPSVSPIVFSRAQTCSGNISDGPKENKA